MVSAAGGVGGSWGGAVSVAHAQGWGGQGRQGHFAALPAVHRTRPDKSVLQATSAAAIADLYDSQPKATHRDENDENEDEEEKDEDEDAI